MTDELKKEHRDKNFALYCDMQRIVHEGHPKHTVAYMTGFGASIAILISIRNISDNPYFMLGWTLLLVSSFVGLYILNLSFETFSNSVSAKAEAVAQRVFENGDKKIESMENKKSENYRLNAIFWFSVAKILLIINGSLIAVMLIWDMWCN